MLSAVLPKRIFLHQAVDLRTEETLQEPPSSYVAMLARSPADFVNMSHVLQTHSGDALHAFSSSTDFTFTNRGIRIRLPIQPLNKDYKTYLGFLACRSSAGDCIAYGIPLHQVSDDQYIRCSVSSEGHIVEIRDFKRKQLSQHGYIFIAQHNVSRNTPFVMTGPGLYAALVDLTPLVHTLELYNLTLQPDFGPDSVLTVSSHCESTLFIMDPVWEASVMAMLVITLQDIINVKVITQGTSDRKNQPTLQEVYMAWSNGEQLPNVQHLSDSSLVEIPDGRRIEIVALPQHNANYPFRLVALPVGMPLQGKREHLD